MTDRYDRDAIRHAYYGLQWHATTLNIRRKEEFETRLHIAEATNRVLTELIYELVSQTLPAATKETTK